MTIRIEGASENNLQNIDIEFGSGLTVVTGVSGSGKTSLVFDTLYHEARRRFLESFGLPGFGSTSGSQHLVPASVRSISGLGPAVAVGQNLLNRNPGSTLATASGLHPFFRLLYARFGKRICATCGAGVSLWNGDAIIERMVEWSKDQKDLVVFAPLVRKVHGSHRTLLHLLTDQVRIDSIRVDGAPWSGKDLAAEIPHSIEIEIGRLPQGSGVAAAREILTQVEQLGVSAVVIRSAGEDEEAVFLRAPVCFQCGAWFGELEPVHFHMPCPFCQGKGCSRCADTGLRPEAAGALWYDMRLPDLLRLSVNEVRGLFKETRIASDRLQIEINRRLDALVSVGLGYVYLNRPIPTLSRGEAQRVRLAVTLVSRLEDMIHVLDEPTIGQHPADVKELLPVLKRLAGPVIYVEHDRIAAAVANHVVDMGPGAGNQGGKVVFSGIPADLWKADTPTGRFFSLRERILPHESRYYRVLPAPDRFLTVYGANLRNLRGFDAPIPLGRLTVITGVSGSGKSTLVEDVLVASLEKGQPCGCRKLDGPALKPVLVDQSPIGINPRSNPATYTGLADIIRDFYAGETGLSSSHFSFNRPEGACPACGGIGALEVQMRYLPSTWIPCADCKGQRFSDEVLSHRVNFEQFSSAYQSLSIAEFLNLPLEEVFTLLEEDPRLLKARRTQALQILTSLLDVGLGYLTPGQPSPTLSGGEAQRVKLARFLGKGKLAGRMIVLDEPSTGLHPRDVAGLLGVLHRLAHEGAAVVVVEHNLDIIRSADWILDLGPGAGPQGGQLLYAGPMQGIFSVPESLTRQAILDEDALVPNANLSEQAGSRNNPISIRDARANNLKSVNIDFPKGSLSVVTGISGSGKSSLVSDVLENEARRRFLEALSMYERQGVREGPEAPVGSVSGLGVSMRLGSERGLYDRRGTVGTASDISHHLAVILAFLGEHICPKCGSQIKRLAGAIQNIMRCPSCEMQVLPPEPRHFLPNNYAAACRVCHGVGSMQIPAPHKLIIHPEKPLCDGAMYSPGFFPKGYLGKPGNGGYDMVQALAARYEFDPFVTPWDKMTPEAQQAFLYGDPEPMLVQFSSKSGRKYSGRHAFPGFYGWVRDWDTGGTYTDTQVCSECGGSRLRPEYGATRLQGVTVRQLNQMPLAELAQLLKPGNLSNLADLELSGDGTILKLAGASLQTLQYRLHFLCQVGLGYLNLDRPTATLSAGEAQRIRLAGLLGSRLTSLTVLLDEPTRGLHPSEVDALIKTLQDLCAAGNTVIVVEHELRFIKSADHVVDMGPGAGAAGGQVVAQGLPDEISQSSGITGQWLRGEKRSMAAGLAKPRPPEKWMILKGARGNNLAGEEISIPLQRLVGFCGVSGSGKSTLVIDTLGRALAPRKHTTSVAREPLDPLPFESISGAPERVVLIDQTRAGLHSPADFLGLRAPILRLFASGADARALGLTEKTLSRQCTACGGSGSQRMDMAFLPTEITACETCRATGFSPEAWDALLHGVALPEIFTFTIDQVSDFLDEFSDEPEVKYLATLIETTQAVGLGYLVMNQPGSTLSGGEAQRLKIASELIRPRESRRPTKEESLFILDEPTVGQHLDDVERLVNVLRRLVEAGTSVLVVEHHPHLLAACDWLIELGPGGGPHGGRLVASGFPGDIARGNTPIAPYLREVFGW